MFGYKMLKNVGLLFILIAIIVGIYYPTRHARRYECVNLDRIMEELYFQQNEGTYKNCNYRNVIFSSEPVMQIGDITQKKVYAAPNLGGEYRPQECNPQLSSAVVIPYRQRSKQLYLFLNYMHNFLQAQKLHYKIFIVDQHNELPFNRANLLNIGAKIAMNEGFPCLILHDIDLIPLSISNIYACTKLPRHMSSSLDSFRYNLPYLTLTGGAVAILSEQFQEINGMSNLFQGWGGEDDDFYERLVKQHLTPIRFCPSISIYTMLPHKKNGQKSQDRFTLLKQSAKRTQFDGLNTLNDNYTIELKPLYTHIIVV